jgi:hypothetical protein
MGGKDREDQHRTTRHLLEPFQSEEERLEALDNFKRYLRTLKGWYAVKRWEARPDVPDLN